jgi:hypothetical protein
VTLLALVVVLIVVPKGLAALSARRRSLSSTDGKLPIDIAAFKP